MSEEEGVRVNDKRRIDPDTFEVRQQDAGEPVTEVGVEAEIIEGEAGGLEEKVSELTEDLNGYMRSTRTTASGSTVTGK